MGRLDGERISQDDLKSLNDTNSRAAPEAARKLIQAGSPSGTSKGQAFAIEEATKVSLYLFFIIKGKTTISRSPHGRNWMQKKLPLQRTNMLVWVRILIIPTGMVARSNFAGNYWGTPPTITKLN